MVYFSAFLFAAQRAFTAATILARPSGDIFRFCFCGATADLGLPGSLWLRLPAPAIRARACFSVAISVSMRVPLRTDSVNRGSCISFLTRAMISTASFNRAVFFTLNAFLVDL